MVAWLEPKEFTSFWVGNKAIYRTRMIIEDGGELLIIAPGVKTFGENSEVDALIRKYGYNGTPYTMDLVRQGIFKGMEMVAAQYDSQFIRGAVYYYLCSKSSKYD